MSKLSNLQIERIVGTGVDQLEKEMRPSKSLNPDASSKTPYHMRSVGCKVLDEMFPKYHSKHAKQRQ
jgi:hypothetical protein